eukprot:5641754-Prymnesium_polylepis.1
MQIVGRVEPGLFEVEGLEDVEHLQSSDPLRVRRKLEDAILAAIRGVDGLDPLAVVRAKVALAQLQAAHVAIALDRVRDAAIVKGGRAARLHLFQRGGKRRVAEDLARARRAPLALLAVRHGECLHEAIQCVRVLIARGERRCVRRHVPLGRDHLGHRMAVLGVADGRLEE